MFLPKDCLRVNVELFKYLNVLIMSKDIVNVFKALSDDTRIDIIRKLLKQTELSCQQLMKFFSLSQPTLSHHFNKLIDAEVLTVRKDGVNHYYGVNKKYLENMGIDINKIVLD